MIEERAVVVSTTPAGVVVTTPGRAGCARCAEGRGCGGGVLGRLTERKQQPTVEAANPTHCALSVGDHVVIGLRDEALIGASLLIYVWPLLSMLLFALSAHLILGWDEPMTTAAGVAGLAIGFIRVARQTRRQDHAARYRPVVLRRANGETFEQCSSDQPGL